MSKCLYNGYKISPTPFVNITKTYQTTEDGTQIGTGFQITIIGKCLAFMGSPRSGLDGTVSSTGFGGFNNLFWITSGDAPTETIPHDSRLSAIFRKEEALRALFAESGHTLEWQAMDGGPPMKCNPRVINIDFKDGLWYQYFDYTITLEADVIYMNGTSISEDAFSEYISEAQEDWQLDVDERAENELLPRTYRLTHSVTAKGKRFYDSAGTLVKPAWKQARDYVSSKLGIDPSIILSSGVNNLPSYYQGLSQARNESIDELGGRYSVTETWVVASGTALEDFTVSLRQSADTGLKTVTIDGTITGLETRDANQQLLLSKHHNADYYWTNTVSPALLSRAQLYTGYSFNINPVTSTVGTNPITGTINYSIEYNTRPSNLFPDSKSEVITVTYGQYTDLFATLTVLGRGTTGQLLQPLNCAGAKTTTLNMEIVFGGQSYGTGSVADLKNAFYSQCPDNDPAKAAIINNIIESVMPVNTVGGVQQYISDQGSTWSASEGRYTKQITFSYSGN